MSEDKKTKEARYAAKRGIKVVKIDFYADDPVEMHQLAYWRGLENKKQLFLSWLAEHAAKNNA